jgi:TatD DNase family protein
MALTDTHCHLDFDWFDADRGLVIERALEAGLDRILNPGIDLNSSRNAIRLAQEHNLIYAAVGMHPSEVEGWDDGTLAELREMASASKVVAIGEIGLDYYHGASWREQQIKIFRQQLDLAAEYSLPVIVHNRDATEDTLQILCAWQETLVKTGSLLAKRPGVLHAFSGNLQDAERAIAHEFVFGVDGPITFKNGENLRQLVATLPPACLLIETDAPFLTPHPFRGSRNEPKNVKYVVEKLAEITNLPVSSVASQTTANAGRIFQW